MIRKDYIQRHFDELAKVLAAMLLLKKNHKPTEAASVLNDFSTDFLGISFEEILDIDDNLIDFLKRKKTFSLDHFKLLEDLLYHKYLLTPTNNLLKNATLEVLKYTSENDTDYSFERMDRIDQIFSK